MDHPEAWKTPPEKRAYARERRKACISVYCVDDAEKERFTAIAKSQGFSGVSQWFVHVALQSLTTTSYPADYVKRLEDDVRKYRGWVEQKEQEIAELRRDLKACELQREDLRVVLAGLTDGQNLRLNDPKNAPRRA